MPKTSDKPTVKRKFGGRQPGAGRPKGKLGKRALTLLEVKNRIAAKADEIINAELVDGLGCNVVLKLDKETKKYKQVTDPEEIVRFIQEHKGASGEVDGEFYIIAAQPGNYKARQYLLDRAFGKPSQSVEVVQDPKVAELRKSIETRAAEKGISFEEELRNYTERYAPDPIKEQLISELTQ